MPAAKPEIRLHYERVGDKKGHSKTHARKRRRRVAHKKDHRLHPKKPKEKEGLAAIWPGKPGPGLKVAFKAADALGIDGKNSKLLTRGIALGQVVSAFFGSSLSSSSTNSRTDKKPGAKPLRRVYDKKPARRKRLSKRPSKHTGASSSSLSSSASSTDTGSSSARPRPRTSSSHKHISPAKARVIARGDDIFPNYRLAYIDQFNNEHLEYMYSSAMEREYRIQEKWVKSTVFEYLDEIEQNVLKQKMDMIDDAIKTMSDTAFAKRKIEYRLKYANLAATAIQLAVEELLQECPGHFLDAKAGRILKGPSDWECEYDKDIMGRKKKPLQAVEDLTYRKTTDKTSVSGALAQYEWFFSRKDNKNHQLRYVESERHWEWYITMSKNLRDMLSSSGPVYEELSNIRTKYQLTKNEKNQLDRIVRLIWNTWTWARFIVCEHWRYIEIDDKTAAVYDERIEMLNDLSVLSDKEHKRAKRKYRDKLEERRPSRRSSRSASRAQSVGGGRSRSRSQSQSRASMNSKR